MKNAITAPFEQAKDYLCQQMQNGSWAYGKQGEDSLEATAWCAMALRDNKKIVDEATAYLLNCQRQDGGWATLKDAAYSDWNSSLAVLALAVVQGVDSPQKNINATFKKALNYFADTRSDLDSFRKFMRLLFYGPQSGTERGWGWTPGTFNWIEPTSYTILALSHLSKLNAQAVDKLLESARAYLLNYSIPAGGWNVGVLEIFGSIMPPVFLNTCQAIHALSDRLSHPDLAAAIAYIDRASKHKQLQSKTVSALSWTILTKDLVKQNYDQQLQDLIALQEKNGSFQNSNFLTGIATVALSVPAQGNPLIVVNTVAK